MEQVQDHCRAFTKGEASGSGQSEGLADEESEPVIGRCGRYFSLEMGWSMVSISSLIIFMICCLFCLFFFLIILHLWAFILLSDAVWNMLM